MAAAVPRFGLVGNAIAVFILSLVFALITWWTFADPTLGGAKALGWDVTFPFPFLFIVVWLILAVVWFGFNFQFSIFKGLPSKQPMRGIALTLVSLVLIVVAYLLLNVVGGRISTNLDPAGPTGFILTAFFVLIGFYTFTAGSITLQHWPFQGKKMPLQGFGVWVSMMVLTLIFYAVLVWPSVLTPAGALMDFYTMTGWWYSVIVGLLIVSLTFGNWPFAKLGKGPGAIVALLASFAVGTLWYFLVVGILNFVVPDAVKAIWAGIPDFAGKTGTFLNYYAAEFGVNFSFWAIFWFLFTGNWPTKGSPAKDGVVRFLICFILATAMFLVTINGFFNLVLHDRLVLSGNWGGDPLNFIDWWIALYLVMAVYFGNWPLMKAAKKV